MAKVLYIKANAKPDEESRTFKISNSFMKRYRETHPEDEITTLDLYQEGIDFLPFGQLNELHQPEAGAGKDHPILKYAYQFAKADKYVIAAPFWNLSIPAILKAYLDYITVTNITFHYTETGPAGLCTGTKAVHIVSRGGYYSKEPYFSFEMGDRYLRTLLGFLGVGAFTTIAAEGLDVIGNDVNAILNKAVKEATDFAEIF